MEHLSHTGCCACCQELLDSERRADHAEDDVVRLAAQLELAEDERDEALVLMRKYRTALLRARWINWWSDFAEWKSKLDTEVLDLRAGVPR